MISLFRSGPKACAAGVYLGKQKLTLVVLERKASGEKRIFLENQFDHNGDYSSADFSQTVKDCLEKHKLKSIDCYLALNYQAYQWLQLPKPQVPEEELNQALLWPVIDSLSDSSAHIQPESICVRSFFMAEESASTARQINAIVTQKKTLKGIEATARTMGFSLKGVGIPEMFLRDFLSESVAKEQCIFVAILVNGLSKLFVLYQGQFFFYRQFEFSANSVESDPHETVALEIQRSLDYCDRHIKSARVEQVILLSEPLLEQRFLHFLNDNILPPVSQANTPFTSQLNNAQGHDLMMAYGAALSSCRNKLG